MLHKLFQPDTLPPTNVLLDDMALDCIYPYVQIPTGPDLLMELSSIPFLSRTSDLICPTNLLPETLDTLYSDYAMSDGNTEIPGSDSFFGPAFEYTTIDPLYPFGQLDFVEPPNTDSQQVPT